MKNNIKSLKNQQNNSPCMAQVAREEAKTKGIAPKTIIATAGPEVTIRGDLGLLLLLRQDTNLYLSSRRKIR